MNLIGRKPENLGNFTHRILRYIPQLFLSNMQGRDQCRPLLRVLAD
jgi:hypothetical protein